MMGVIPQNELFRKPDSPKTVEFISLKNLKGFELNLLLERPNHEGTRVAFYLSICHVVPQAVEFRDDRKSLLCCQYCCSSWERQRFREETNIRIARQHVHRDAPSQDRPPQATPQ